MLIAFSTLLLVIAVVSLVGWIVLKPEPVILQGQAEATEVRVSGKVPGRIDKFMVSEGMTVNKGDTLVLISAPELNAKLMQANSAEDAADAQNQKANKGARAEQIAGAYEMWQKAEVGVKLAEKTYNRVRICSMKVLFLHKKVMKPKLITRQQSQLPRPQNRNMIWQ